MNENINEINENIPPKSPAGKKSALQVLVDWLETFAFAFVFVLVVFTFASKIVTVDGASMNRTLNDNEKLIISNLFYTPKTGDIVVVSRERADKEPIIKRVIATEGQKVEIDFENWQVTVDGVVLDEPYVNRTEGTMHDGHCPESFTVGEGMVFVMGDNRNNSTDSRLEGSFRYTDDGFVYELDERVDPFTGEPYQMGYTEKDVMGRVLFRVLPLGKFGAVKPAE